MESGRTKESTHRKEALEMDDEDRWQTPNPEAFHRRFLRPAAGAANHVRSAELFCFHIALDEALDHQLRSSSQVLSTTAATTTITSSSRSMAAAAAVVMMMS